MSKRRLPDRAALQVAGKKSTNIKTYLMLAESWMPNSYGTSEMHFNRAIIAIEKTLRLLLATDWRR